MAADQAQSGKGQEEGVSRHVAGPEGVAVARLEDLRGTVLKEDIKRITCERPSQEVLPAMPNRFCRGLRYQHRQLPQLKVDNESPSKRARMTSNLPVIEDLRLGSPPTSLLSNGEAVQKQPLSVDFELGLKGVCTTTSAMKMLVGASKRFDLRSSEHDEKLSNSNLEGRLPRSHLAGAMLGGQSGVSELDMDDNKHHTLGDWPPDQIMLHNSEALGIAADMETMSGQHHLFYPGSGTTPLDGKECVLNVGKPGIMQCVESEGAEARVCKSVPASLSCGKLNSISKCGAQELFDNVCSAAVEEARKAMVAVARREGNAGASVDGEAQGEVAEGAAMQLVLGESLMVGKKEVGSAVLSVKKDISQAGLHLSSEASAGGEPNGRGGPSSMVHAEHHAVTGRVLLPSKAQSLDGKAADREPGSSNLERLQVCGAEPAGVQGRTYAGRKRHFRMRSLSDVPIIMEPMESGQGWSGTCSGERSATADSQSHEGERQKEKRAGTHHVESQTARWPGATEEPADVATWRRAVIHGAKWGGVRVNMADNEAFKKNPEIGSLTLAPAPEGSQTREDATAVLTDQMDHGGRGSAPSVRHFGDGLSITPGEANGSPAIVPSSPTGRGSSFAAWLKTMGNNRQWSPSFPSHGQPVGFLLGGKRGGHVGADPVAVLGCANNVPLDVRASIQHDAGHIKSQPFLLHSTREAGGPLGSTAANLAGENDSRPDRMDESNLGGQAAASPGDMEVPSLSQGPPLLQVPSYPAQSQSRAAQTGPETLAGVPSASGPWAPSQVEKVQEVPARDGSRAEVMQQIRDIELGSYRPFSLSESRRPARSFASSMPSSLSLTQSIQHRPLVAPSTSVNDVPRMPRVPSAPSFRSLQQEQHRGRILGLGSVHSSQHGPGLAGQIGGMTPDIPSFQSQEPQVQDPASVQAWRLEVTKHPDDERPAAPATAGKLKQRYTCAIAFPSMTKSNGMLADIVAFLSSHGATICTAGGVLALSRMAHFVAGRVTDAAVPSSGCSVCGAVGHRMNECSEAPVTQDTLPADQLMEEQEGQGSIDLDEGLESSYVKHLPQVDLSCWHGCEPARASGSQDGAWRLEKDVDQTMLNEAAFVQLAGRNATEPMVEGEQHGTRLGPPLPRPSGCDCEHSKQEHLQESILVALESIRLSRKDLARWQKHPNYGSRIAGFFLRLRIGRHLGGTGYKVACLLETSTESALCVDVDDKVSNVDIQYVSNKPFTEEELADWWSANQQACRRSITKKYVLEKFRERLSWR
eukprot:SM000046S16399  [mRNA]  locus=s46:435909:441313:+ [translate_table: standard]